MRLRMKSVVLNYNADKIYFEYLDFLCAEHPIKSGYMRIKCCVMTDGYCAENF